MKGGIAAAAVAALAGGVSAAHHRHGHDHLFAKRGSETGVCVPTCTTIWTTITGAATLVPIATTTTATVTNTATVSCKPTPPVPTPQPHTCPTPGTYTFSATTITVNQTTTVCGAATTKVPAGTHTVGGVTTVVKTSTTVVCPVATVTTSGNVTTSTILQTTYVCPTPGTYTIAPHTTTVTKDTVIVYPVPTSYSPGTYTAPRQVVTVTETDYVTYCPFTSVGLPTAPAPQPTKAAPPPPPPPANQKQAPPPQYNAPPPASPGGLTSGNDHFGITYTPYQATSGACKSASQVDSDIAKLKAAGFSTVRVYSTDCNTLENVGSSCQKYGMGMIVGVFVKDSGCSYGSPDIKEQVDALSAWDKWGLVKLVVVGNEAIMNGFCSPQQLRDLITTVKSKCSQYSGPYTISETLNVWQRSDVSSAICGVVGVTGANIHPYFNSDVTPDAAGDFVAGQLQLLRQVCNGNDVINLECGWPTRGNCNGKACPGHEEQASAIKSIRDKTGSKTVFFSFENDLWKDAGSCGCEQSWGAAASFHMINVSI
ncbi:beta-glucosidase btgE [Tolypocladium capitatum]|uniref:Probable beta-glucosidase btgE n=1 Tax=Tolypocladium capitatum TaxID=45235 RepID=A0A2K3Q8R6_9HYPO|nr:beta-glucosidase btgE [Tolypocladium capitatum]